MNLTLLKVLALNEKLFFLNVTMSNYEDICDHTWDILPTVE